MTLYVYVHMYMYMHVVRNYKGHIHVHVHVPDDRPPCLDAVNQSLDYRKHALVWKLPCTVRMLLCSSDPAYTKGLLDSYKPMSIVLLI